MKYEDIMALLDKGFTSDYIMKMEDTAEASPDPEEKPEETPEEKPADTVTLEMLNNVVETFTAKMDSVVKELQAANIISWIAAVTFAYFTNRIFVFESKNRNMIREAGSFFLSRISTLLMDMAIMFVAVTLLGMNDKIAKLIVQVIVTIANYVISKFFVFQKK